MAPYATFIENAARSQLINSLAQQVVAHFKKRFSEENTRRVVRFHQEKIAKFLHTQMQPHFQEKAKGYEVIVHSGFTSALKESAYTTRRSQTASNRTILDYHQSPEDKSNWGKYLFTGFSRCLYETQKFDSESERLLSVILERDALKWFRPARDEFKIYYHANSSASYGQQQYQPDFVAEATDTVLLGDSGVVRLQKLVGGFS